MQKLKKAANNNSDFDFIQKYLSVIRLEIKCKFLIDS